MYISLALQGDFALRATQEMSMILLFIDGFANQINHVTELFCDSKCTMNLISSKFVEQTDGPIMHQP